MPPNRTRRVNLISAISSIGTDHAPESLDFDASVSAFLRYCRIRNLSEHTLAFYSDTLKELIRLLKAQNIERPIDVTRAHIMTAIETKQNERIKRGKSDKPSDHTMNKLIRGWRAFFNFLYDEGFLPNNPYNGIKAIKAEKSVIQTFNREQMKRLLDAPNRKTFTGYRDYVLMLLLFDTGIRVSEAANIQISDIYWKERQIKIFGKGRKERLVPFSKTLARHLRDYISIRGLLNHDYLFVNIDNNPFQPRGIQQALKDYGIAAGIKGVRVSPHTFRHTFAKNWIMNGGDVFSLQKILGHTSLEVVRMYVNLFSADVLEKHDLYSPLERLDEDGGSSR
jgi:integrase/recombinase XerD